MLHPGGKRFAYKKDSSGKFVLDGNNKRIANQSFCPVCDNLFTMSQDNQVFCSAKCRIYKHRSMRKAIKRVETRTLFASLNKGNNK